MIQSYTAQDPEPSNDAPVEDVQAQAQVQAQTQPATEPTEQPSVLLDVLAAPFRGVEDAARSAYGLVNYITADSLPKWDKNWTGKSQTPYGNVVENVSQFLTAFVPVVGVAGRAGAALGLVGKAATFASAAAAGAAADFTAFSGKEERLSNLIQSYPKLANPVTEYLSAKPGDGEIEGRFKNALEGLGLGALTEGVLGALNVVRAGRAAQAGEITATAADDVAKAEASKIGDSLVSTKPNKTLSVPALTPELDDQAKQLAAIDLDDTGSGGLFQSPEKFVGRNLDTSKEVNDLLAATSEQLQATDAAKGLDSSEAIAARQDKVAQVLDVLTQSSDASILYRMQSQNAALKRASYETEAAAPLMLSKVQEARFYAEAAASGNLPAGMTKEQALLHSAKAQEMFVSLVEQVRQTGTTLGRALNSRRYIKSAQIESQSLAKQLVDDLGGSDYLTVQFRKLAMADGAGGAAAQLNRQLSLGGRLFRAHNEYWINSILSGTKTGLVNTIGNATTTLYQPLEQAIGGAFALDGKAVAASLKNYAYLAHSFTDSWGFAMKAFKEDANILNRGSTVQDLKTAGSSRAISGQALLGDNDTALAHFIDFVGTATNLPSRILQSTDEFFKQINYRAAAKTELYYRGLNQGLKDDALDAFVGDGFSKVITEGGERYSESAVVNAAYAQAEEKGLTGKAKTDFIADYREANWNPENSALKDTFDVATLANGVSDEATFTAPLGTLGKSVQAFARAHPISQLLIPFVRTPTNIIKYASDRGLGALTFMPGINKIQARNVAELASADGLVRSRAMGRLATGQMMVSTAALAALQGRITGHGPTNAAELANLKETGWRPYSVVIPTAEGPHYVSYQRIDPFATFLGLFADWAEQAKRHDPFMQDTLQATLTAAATAVSNNVTNKTYLASLAQAIDAINAPDRKFATWSRARVGSYVPSLLAQFNSGLDDGQTMKEVRGFFDGAINRIPGAQGMLESKRNVLGEPVDSALAQTPLSAINPFTLSKDRGDAVSNELASFNHGLQPPSPLVYGKVNLLDHKTADGHTAFDRWQELTGTVTVGGKTLRAQLEKLIGNSAYQKLSTVSPADGYDTPRLGAARSVIQAYRTAALGQLQKEVPSVGQAVKSYQLGQAALRRGDRATALSRVQEVIASAQ